MAENSRNEYEGSQLSQRISTPEQRLRLAAYFAPTLFVTLRKRLSPDRFAAFEQAILAEAAEFRNRFGVTLERLDQAALYDVEPYLSDQAIGAIHWTNAWAVTDPGSLVLAYADRFVADGGELRQGEVEELKCSGNDWTIKTDQETLKAEEVVPATGPWSPEWLKKLGYHMPILVQRGYHMHYDSQGGAELHHSVMDREKGYVFGPKQAGLCLTTGAELDTINAPPRLGQLEAAEHALRGLYPLGKRVQARQPLVCIWPRPSGLYAGAEDGVLAGPDDGWRTAEAGHDIVSQ